MGGGGDLPDGVWPSMMAAQAYRIGTIVSSPGLSPQFDAFASIYTMPLTNINLRSRMSRPCRASIRRIAMSVAIAAKLVRYDFLAAFARAPMALAHGGRLRFLRRTQQAMPLPASPARCRLSAAISSLWKHLRSRRRHHRAAGRRRGVARRICSRRGRAWAESRKRAAADAAHGGNQRSV